VPEYLTINAAAGGTTSPTTGTYAYDYPYPTISVLATADTGYRFTQWQIDNSSSATNPISVDMSASHTLTPVFIKLSGSTYNITINSDPNGTTNPTAGTYTENAGATVVVQANANSGYKFDHWIANGVNNTSNPITVVMNADTTLTPVFAVGNGGGGGGGGSGTNMLPLAVFAGAAILGIGVYAASKKSDPNKKR
jgi:hypothetical protein